MNLYLRDHAGKYAPENIIRIFFPVIRLLQGKRDATEKNYIYYRRNKRRFFLCYVADGEKKTAFSRADVEFDNDEHKDITPEQRFIYNFLKEITGTEQPWGMLCGVRPLFLYRRRRDRGLTADETRKLLQTRYDVSENKAELLRRIYETQERMPLARSLTNYSLYISIPYCPSRCRYCSFISMESPQNDERERYVEKLCRELATVKATANEKKLSLFTIYIGGGTPTSLETKELYRLLDFVNHNFSAPLEFTVEAGRPDCTTYEKLELLKQAGVTRISVNPQTFNDEILNIIGRRHSANDVVKCFENARKVGHDNINMDLIAGLPHDTLGSFTKSLERTLALLPESITVHSFTKKSGSFYSLGDFAPNSDLYRMTDVRDELLADYNPYYIYRQKKTPANLENVGYAKKGYESLYNVYMMDELHTVLSAGAGAVTKFVEENRTITRNFHSKYPREYMAEE